MISLYIQCTRDSIDRLPDDVLISIVSRLPVIEVGKSSVVSHRWRYLWKFSSILDFDTLTLLLESDEPVWLEDERTKFVTMVNKVIDLHSAATIDQFRIAFDLDRASAKDIGKWLQFAFAKRVQMLELNLSRTYTDFPDMPYSFPNMCGGCESLVTLSLIGVDVSEETLEFFISNCPFLEELRVRYSFYLKKFTPSSPLIRLKSLEIATVADCKSIVVCAPKLLSFAFYGMVRIPMALENVSSLISLSIGAMDPRSLMDNINQIQGCLSQLETLKLRTSIYNVSTSLMLFFFQIVDSLSICLYLRFAFGEFVSGIRTAKISRFT